jgi:hypothetical protein
VSVCLIKQVDLDEGLVAGRIKAMEARASMGPPKGAGTQSPAIDRNELLAALTGSSSDAVFGGSQPALDLQARQLWEGASKSSFTVWAKSMQEAVKADIAERRAAGRSRIHLHCSVQASFWGCPGSYLTPPVVSPW